MKKIILTTSLLACIFTTFSVSAQTVNLRIQGQCVSGQFCWARAVNTFNFPVHCDMELFGYASNGQVITEYFAGDLFPGQYIKGEVYAGMFPLVNQRVNLNCYAMGY